MTDERIAFVPARFGADTTGGAEIVLSRLASGFRDRGWRVDVLTTCATDHFTWDNVLPAGVTKEDGLTVHRFPAVRSTAGAERAVLEQQILAGLPVLLREQYRWMNDGMRVPELFHYLLDHGRDYRAVVLGPYPFWPAFACSQILAERSVLWTCLHDERYAYLELFRPVFTGVAGLLLQSPPEHELLHRLIPSPARHALTGCGVEVPQSYDPEGFRARHGLDRRFVLYAGRREGAKGWEELLDGFAMAVQRGLQLCLVTIGGGEVHPPAAVADRVIDLGFLPDHERDNAFAAADAYVQPSRFEAFSRTIMEAWLAGTPVIANAGSAVVEYHCQRSGAGLLYNDVYELEQCLAFIAAEPGAARAIARPGRHYVLTNYQWPAVLDAVETAIREWTIPCAS
jgi:glycosyltransferase involved in cell wall biosynthesis